MVNITYNYKKADDAILNSLNALCNEIYFWDLYVSLDEVLIINKNTTIEVLYQEENIEDNVNTKKLRKYFILENSELYIIQKMFIKIY